MRRTRKPAVSIGTSDMPRMMSFFAAIGWDVAGVGPDATVVTAGGRFGLHQLDDAPRMELALNLPDPLEIDALAEVVDAAGGITMEPLQETVWGGWGFAFNDPSGNTWEVGSPWTVTAVDRFLSHGVRPSLDGPIVALVVPSRRSLPQTG